MFSLTELSKLCRKIVLICFVALLMSCVGCGYSPVQSLQQNTEEPSMYQSNQPPENRITGLVVYSFIENENHIYHIRYPYDFYCPDYDSKYGSYSSSKKIEPDYKKADGLYGYFVDYVKSLPQSSESEGELSAFVNLDYIDENGEQTCGVSLYGGFPKGWDEFIQNVNLICGRELLSTKGEMVCLNADFLRDYFNINDDDITGDKNVEDFLTDGLMADAYSSGVLKLQLVNFYFIQKAIENYENKISGFNDYIAKDIISHNTSPQEFETFIKTFCEQTGCEEITNDNNRGYRYFISPGGHYYGLIQTGSIDPKKDMIQIGACTLEVQDDCLVFIEEGEKGAFGHLSTYYDRTRCYLLVVYDIAESSVLNAFINGKAE